MSGGLNREFHDDPVAFFLKYNVYGGNLVGGGVPPNPFPGAAVLAAANVWDVGAYTEDFDFVAVAGNATRVRLESWAERLAAPRPEHFRSLKLRAYYLPQQNGMATRLTVGGWSPSYVFTTQLSGCRVAMEGAPHLRIAHIAAAAAAGAVNQDLLETAALPGANHRRFYDPGTAAVGLVGGLSAQYPVTGFVFGYRPHPGSAWKMYGQAHGDPVMGASDELPRLVRLL
jgi:hypothetical protein